MKVNVSAIISHKDKVLLIQRDINDKHFPGHWGVPGGGMEEGDSSIEAVAIREVFEEVGIHIIPQQIRFNNRHKDVIFIVTTAILADKSEFSKKLDISDEVYNYEWADIKSLEEKNFTPFTQERLVEVLEETASNEKK